MTSDMSDELAEAEMSPGIDCAINAAAKALADSYDKDYYHRSAADQAWWRGKAQIVVDAWQEDRRRSAEENIPDAAPSLRAELAEAKATIARLTEESESKLSGYRQMARDWDAQYEAWLGIVVAATALRDYDAQFAYPGDQWVSKREQLVRAVVTAVEEGRET